MAEVYFMWYITIAFSDINGLLILCANSIVMGVLLNDNIPFFKYAINNNYKTYVALVANIYGYRAVLYSYNRIKYNIRNTNAAVYIEDYLFKESEPAYI
jgi:hypothetical protein